MRNVDLKKREKKKRRQSVGLKKAFQLVCGLRWVLIAASARPSRGDQVIKCPPIRRNTTKMEEDPPGGLMYMMWGARAQHTSM